MPCLPSVQETFPPLTVFGCCRELGSIIYSEEVMMMINWKIIIILYL